MDEATRLEQLAHQLEQDGDDMKAIRYMEKAASLRGDSPLSESLFAFERLVIKYNTVAVRSFKSDDYETAAALLANAIHLTDPSRSVWEVNTALRLRLRGTTYNNMGCMERRRGRLELAAKYLRMSLDHDGSQSAVTYLNLGAIYTQMGRPEEAVASSRRAIGLLSATSTSSDSAGLLAIAHHNLAMALEPLDRDSCVAAYESALSLAKAQLGLGSPTTISIQRNFDRFLMSARNATRGPTTSGRPPAPSQTFLPPISNKSSSLTQKPPRRVSPEASTPRPRSNRLAASQDEPKSARKPVPPGTAPAAGGRAPRPPGERTKVGVRRANAFEKNGRSDSADTGSESDHEATSTPPKAKDLKANKQQPVAPSLPKNKAIVSASPTSETAAKQPETVTNGRIRQLDPEDERRKDDVIAFMVSRLGALLRAEEEYEIRYLAAVKIQCLARRVAASEAAEKRRIARRQGVLFREAREKKSANDLIAFFRLLVARRRAAQEERDATQREAVRRDKAAVKIQSVARRWLAKQLVKRLRIYYRDYTKALRRLQCWFRKEIASRRVHKMKLVERDSTKQKLISEKRNFAAVQIQRYWRSCEAIMATATRKSSLRAAREKDRESRRTQSAKRIQALFRGVLGRRKALEVKTQRRNFLCKLERMQLRADATLSIQAFVRGCMSRAKSVNVVAQVRARRAARLHVTRRTAVIRMQCFVRRVLARLRVRRLGAARRLSFRCNRLQFVARILMPFVQGIRSNAVFVAKFAPPIIVRLETPEELHRLRSPPSAMGPFSPAGERSIPPLCEPETIMEVPDAVEVGAAATDVQPQRPQSPSYQDECTPPPRQEPKETAIPFDAEPRDVSMPEPTVASLASVTTEVDTVPALTEPPLERDDATMQQTTQASEPVDEAPYVVPPRVPTPPHLKLSVQYLEEKRKRELTRRQLNRLAALDSRVRATMPADTHAEQERQALAQQQQAQATKLSKAHKAAERIQAFFRGVFDRHVFRDKRAVIAEYVDALEVAHRVAPNKPPVLPKPVDSLRRPSFTALQEITDRVGTARIRQSRVTEACIRVQAALHVRASRSVGLRRAAQWRTIRDRAAAVLSRFGRRVIAVARVRARRRAVLAQHEARLIADEAQYRASLEREAELARQAAAAAELAASTACRVAAESRRSEASRVLQGFRKIVLAKAEVRKRLAGIASAIEALVAMPVQIDDVAEVPSSPCVQLDLGMLRRNAAQAVLHGFHKIVVAKASTRRRIAAVRSDTDARVDREIRDDAASMAAAAQALARRADVLDAGQSALRTDMMAEECECREALVAQMANEAKDVEAAVRAAVERKANELQSSSAVAIQCAFRQSQARKETAERRSAKQAQWKEIAEAEDVPESALPNLRDTPAVEEPSLVAPAPSLVAPVPSTSPQDAAATIQRNFRAHAARNEVARLRAEANERWEQRRAQIAAEEADVSF